MIKENVAISMAEAQEFVKNSKDEGKEMKSFIKKFTSLTDKKAKELRKQLNSLEIIKLDEKSISKIIDFMPQDNEDLGKIFSGIGLDDEEASKILETVRGFK